MDATTAQIDFAGATAGVGPWSYVFTVRGSLYTDASHPKADVTVSFTAFDPCDDAAALTINSAYLTSLSLPYDLFDGPDSYTVDTASVASASGPEITDANCGAMVVSLAYGTGPSTIWYQSGFDYDLWGSDPATETGSLELTLTAYLTDYPTTTEVTGTVTHDVTNTCAAVTLTPGQVYEDGVATTSVAYENGQEDVVLTFDEFV